MRGSPEPMYDHIGGDDRQSPEEKLQILLQGKDGDLPSFIESRQSGAVNDLQMVELQMPYPRLANTLQGKEHIFQALSGNSENEMGAELQAAGRLYSPHDIVEIGKAVVTIQKRQASFVDTLQPQFKEAFLAGFFYQMGKLQQQIIRNIIRPCGEDQADAINIGKQQLQDRQQSLGWRGSAGFLLEIGKVFFESPLEKMRLPLGNLLGYGIAISQVGRGKPGRPAEDAAAIKSVGTWLPQVKGNFTNSMTKPLPIMITEATENGWRHCCGISPRPGREKGGQLFTQPKVHETTGQRPLRNMMYSMLVTPIAHIIIVFAFFDDNRFPWLAKGYHQRNSHMFRHLKK